MPETLPDRVQVVVVGGGIVGCSVAHHLNKRGVTDVLLLEQNTLTSGTTWHAAGLVTQARPTSGTREIVKRSLEIYRNLEAETGLSTGYMPTGTLHLALSEAQSAPLVSADRRLIAKAKGTPFAKRTLRLSEFLRRR